MQKKIDVVGISCDDMSSFSTTARKALSEASIIFASEAQAAIIQHYFPQLHAQIKPYPSPISTLERKLSSDQRIVMMALGDPLFYGIGAILLRFLPAERLRFHPTISSLQAALSRFALPWNDLSIISLHGCDLSSLSTLAHTQGRYGILTDERNSPQRIAEKLVEVGHENALIRIAESLGRADEKLSTYNAKELIENKPHFSPLLVLIIETTTSPS